MNSDNKPSKAPKIYRRTALRAGAWSVPAIAVATSAQAAAASVSPSPAFRVATLPWDSDQQSTLPGFRISVEGTPGPVAVTVSFTPEIVARSAEPVDITELFNLGNFTRTGDTTEADTTFSLTAPLTPGGDTGDITINLSSIANGTYSVVVTGGDSATLVVSGAPEATTVKF